jgi:uncharacterized protein (TIGR02246 family)
MIKQPRLLRWLCTLALALPSPVARATAAPPDVDFQAARAWLASYSASLNKGDLDTFGRLWAEDADWAPPDAPMRSGRQAILGSVRATLDNYALSHRYTAQAIKVVEGFGVAKITATERYTPKGGGGQAAWEQNVRGVIIMRRAEDGSWTATHFIWNRDAPLAH